ncbi:MAG: sensor histidine kinase, partial [Gloeobacteraceae cyanobacterium ES-bin-316]|nr:sensor histidine kinase [Ferruginibacter sp.]
MRIFVSIISVFFFYAGALSQQKSVRDSLSALLPKAVQDSSAVNLYYAYGESCENDLPDSAEYYYKKAKALAQKIGYKKGVAAFSSHYIVLLNNRGAFREALNTAKEALEIYKQVGDKKDLAIANLNVGSEWQYLSEFGMAAEHYLEAKKTADEIKDKKLQRLTNNNLASVFIELQQYEKGMQYAQRSLLIAKELKNDYAISSSMYNIATALMHLNEHEKALGMYKEIEQIGHTTADHIVLLDGWLGMADAYSALNNYLLSEQYYNKVIDFSQAKNTPEYEMYACMGMGDLQLKIKNFSAGDQFIKRGIELAKKLESRYELKDLYLKASRLYEEKGDAILALDFRKKFEVLNDSIVGEKSRALVSNLEAKYEFEKKESTIKQLGAENKVQELTINRKNILNYLLISGAVILLVIFLLSYRNYTQKQKLQQQRISDLETRHLLTATEAVLKGEEQERSRLAKDLHDGLGGMLSGIKYSLNTMKGNLILTPENAQAFERSMDMLDSSIKEMRRVAHNMMPEALVKFGLDTALKDFCNDISNSGALQVSYQSIGVANASIDQTIAITIYRIVQELLNNTMKHAGALTALVQLTKEENQMSVTVEDDGKGFDTVLLGHSGGIGWSSIQNRVEFLKGKLDVHSQPDKG